MHRPRLSDIGNLVDRLLHERRRSAALRELAERPIPRSFLFVCYGNICRSPYAAKAFERLLRESSFTFERIDSAGFTSPGQSTPSEGLAVAASRQIDLQGHVSKLFTADLIHEHELIVVMDASQKRGLKRRFGKSRPFLVLGDLDPSPIETRAIVDPWRQPVAAFERSYDRIDRCLIELRRVIQGTATVHPDLAPLQSHRGPESAPEPPPAPSSAG